MKKNPVDTIAKCIWCGKQYKTKLYNGYQLLSSFCCKEHARLHEEERIKFIGSTDPEDMERIG